MICYRIGDVIEGFEKCMNNSILVHGCNCFHTMGAGIAKRIKQLFPDAYTKDQFSKYGDKSKLGTYTLYTYEDLDTLTYKTIVNAYTQFDFGNNGKPPVDYKAIKDVMTKINEDFPNEIIFMPKIGCGLAGGNWDIVSEILDKVFKDRIIYVYSLY